MLSNYATLDHFVDIEPLSSMWSSPTARMRLHKAGSRPGKLCVTYFCQCTRLIGMHTKDAIDPEDDDSGSSCSLFTTSTATTLHNAGAGRTMGTLISWGGRALERWLARMAYEIGRCPRAIEHRVRKRINEHVVYQPCYKHCSECNALRRDTLRLVDYIR